LGEGGQFEQNVAKSPWPGANRRLPSHDPIFARLESLKLEFSIVVGAPLLP
jgi:hypothetical protein